MGGNPTSHKGKLICNHFNLTNASLLYFRFGIEISVNDFSKYRGGGGGRNGPLTLAKMGPPNEI